jgi:hypothetical protein
LICFQEKIQGCIQAHLLGGLQVLSFVNLLNLPAMGSFSRNRRRISRK